ncbi:AMP-binding protein [Myxococcaceae bacterium GXIMD 01537]
MGESPPPISFDIPTLARTLALGGEAGVPGWLEDSWLAPQPFFQALQTYMGGATAQPLKSQPYDGGCDLYHDLVARHLKQRREVLVSYAAGAGWRRLSYDDLHARVGALAVAWEAAGAKAGQTVAIVLPLEEEYVVAVATALRLGLMLSVLPPRGAAFVLNRLKLLAPDFVVSHPRYASLLGDPAPASLPLTGDGPAPSALRSHTYGPADVAARLFSPLSATPEQPVDVPAGPLFLGLLRDAALVLGLRPTDRVALPGFEALQHQPHALLATMLAGGCFVECEEQALADEETRGQLDPTVVGVSPALRDKLLQGQVRPDRWRLWLRNLAEPYDWDRWEQFGARLVPHKRCRGMNWVANAAFTGTLFFSPPQGRPSHFFVLPTPGQPWELGALIGGGGPSHGESGLYTASGEGASDATSGQFLLSRTRTGFFLAGSPRLGSRGQTYPAAEVVEVIERNPDVVGAAAVVTPASQPLHQTAVSLLVFIDPGREFSDVVGLLRPELERRLDLEMGARYRPDTVHFYPLAPRRTEEGAVDAEWCHWQFLSGALDRKAKDEVFRMLGHLRLLLTRASGAPTREK